MEHDPVGYTCPVCGQYLSTRLFRAVSTHERSAKHREAVADARVRSPLQKEKRANA